MQIGQEVTTIDGKRGKIKAGPQRLFETDWMAFYVEAGPNPGRWYFSWQLTPVEPERPKYKAGDWCDTFVRGVCGFVPYLDCGRCFWRVERSSDYAYLQRAVMAWGPSVPWHCLRTEPCARRDSQKRCIGSDPCDIEGCTPAELMICDHAGECKKVRDPGCSHDKPHESLPWGKTWCPDTHNGFHRCFEDSKCIPYQGERDWFVVEQEGDYYYVPLQGAVSAAPLMTKKRAMESLKDTDEYHQRRAFRWSQGVRG